MVQAVVDSGSTKADWRILTEESVSAFTTKGMNPYFLSSDELSAAIHESVLPELRGLRIDRIHFYGAGCGTDTRKLQVFQVLERLFPDAEVNVETDLLAAARALLQEEPGFAVILGTGTNSGLYDGRQLVQSIDSLGYFLGDEGSGASIGKKLLRDYLRGFLPKDLHLQFAAACPMNRDEVLEQLYRKPFPNRFLASWVPFAVEHQDHHYIRHLVAESFTEFCTGLLMKYENAGRFPMCCTGSVGYLFRSLLDETVSRFGIRILKNVPSPIDGLLDYHRSH